MEPRSSVPTPGSVAALALSIVCASASAFLGYQGLNSFVVAGAHGETGEGILAVIVLGVAAWGFAVALMAFLLSRVAHGLSASQFAVRFIAATAGAAPTLVGCLWVLSLILH